MVDLPHWQDMVQPLPPGLEHPEVGDVFEQGEEAPPTQQSVEVAHWYLFPPTLLQVQVPLLQYPLQQLLVVVPVQGLPTTMQLPPPSLVPVWHVPDEQISFPLQLVQVEPPIPQADALWEPSGRQLFPLQQPLQVAGPQPPPS